MVLAIGSSLRLLLWASALLGMLMYLFAVGFLQIVEDKLVDAMSTPGTDPTYINEMRFYWGSLPIAVYTLFLSITNGISWDRPAETLRTISPVMIAAYCVYIAIAVFCVLNTITGIFVEKANAITSADEDCRLWSELSKRRRWVRQVKDLFDKADPDQTGKVDWDGFQEMMRDIHMQENLKSLGVDVLATEPRMLFDLFDADGGGTIEIDEFASGLQTLHGFAKAVDVAGLKYALRGLSRKVSQLDHSMSRQVSDEGGVETEQVFRPSRQSYGDASHGSRSGEADASLRGSPYQTTQPATM